MAGKLERGPVRLLSGGCALLLAFGCTAELGGPGAADGVDGTGASVGEGGEGSATGGLGAVASGGRGSNGSGGKAGSSGGPPDAAAFGCTAEAATDSAPLRRLTDKQYSNTLSDLFLLALGDADEAGRAKGELNDPLSRITPDERPRVPQDLHGSYRRLDQRVQQSHVDAWYEVAEAAGKALTSGGRAALLLGSCDELGCLDDFIRSFGRLALRRPLSNEDVALYRAFYGDRAAFELEGVADVVAGFLNAPEFLYLVESGGSEAGTHEGSYRLQAYELASRLSYHFWNTMPDQRLLDLAESGALLEDASYEAEVERLWLDPRTDETLTDFFREWLKLENLPDLDRNNDANIFQNFAGDNLPSSELKQAMQDEALDLLKYLTWSEPSALSEVFQTKLNFAKSDELAALYQATAWDGKSKPSALPDGRPGLLTRAAFLSTGTANTRPIMKGVFIRTNVLCDKIEPPPDAAAANPPDLSPTFTTREVVEELTGSGICAECHQTYMNDLGFATEGFDSLGRVRTEQALFNEDGDEIAKKTIKTESVPQVVLGDMTVSQGPADLMRLIAESGKVEACFSRHYFRFTFGRFEDTSADGCVLERMRSSLVETGSLADMLLDVAESDEFRSRSFEGSAN